MCVWKVVRSEPEVDETPSLEDVSGFFCQIDIVTCVCDHVGPAVRALSHRFTPVYLLGAES